MSWALPIFKTEDKWPLCSASAGVEAARIESILAVARVVLVASALAAIYLDPTGPVPVPPLAYTLLAVYLGLSVAFLAWTRRRPISRNLVPIVHAADSLVVLLIVTQRPNSPFFLFFTFVVVAAAYRWRFWETATTAGLFLLVFIAQGLFMGTTGGGGPALFAMRSAYLAILAVLLGYLAEQDKRIKDENLLVSRLIQVCEIEKEFNLTIAMLLKMIGDFYRAKHVDRKSVV